MNTHRLIKWGWPLAPFYFVPVAAAWLVCATIGFFWTLGATLRKSIALTGTDQHGAKCWEWRGAFANRWFQTTDNGACPVWWWERRHAGDTEGYFDPNKACWECWRFSGRRNAFGGNPWNMNDFPTIDALWWADESDPTRLNVRFKYDRVKGTEKPVYWLFTQSRRQPWKVGIWILIPRRAKANKVYRHFEIRHGFKFYPDASLPNHEARFSVWDTGPRA